MVVGKGHETTQTLADATVAFDDREEVRRAVARRFDSTDQDESTPPVPGR
jgi:hypothetical protein